MKRRPDTIRAVVLVFVMGLAVTGLTSLQATDDEDRVLPAEITSQGQWFEPSRSEG